MITRERYIQLRGWEVTGANLAPCDLDRLAEYEEANGLRKVHGNTVFRQSLDHFVDAGKLIPTQD